jgi:hypothetical protein
MSLLPFLIRAAHELTLHLTFRFVNLAQAGRGVLSQRPGFASQVPTELAAALSHGLHQVERHRGSLAGWTDTGPPAPRLG